MKVSREGGGVLVGPARISASDARRLAGEIEAKESFPDWFTCGSGTVKIKTSAGADNMVLKLPPVR